MFDTKEEFAKGLKEYLDPEEAWDDDFERLINNCSVSSVVANNFIITTHTGKKFIIHVKEGK